jgi:hypothetical protein
VSTTISIKVSAKDLKSILITAVESGYCNYWAEFKNYSHKRGVVMVREHNDEEDEKKRGKWIKVTTTVIAQGLERCAGMPSDEGGWAFTQWLEDRTGDGPCADNILQFGVLKELKYG